MSGQRPRAQEPHRTADRAHHGSASRDWPRRSALGGQTGGARRRRCGRHGARGQRRSPNRSTTKSSRGSSRSGRRSTGPFMARDLTRDDLRALVGLGPAADLGQLPDADRAVQHAAGRLQALPELPSEASVPHAVPAVQDRPACGCAVGGRVPPAPRQPDALACNSFSSVCPETGFTRYVAPTRRASSLRTGSSNPENTTRRTSGLTARASSASCRPLNAPRRTSVIDDVRLEHRDFLLRVFEGAARDHLVTVVGQEAAQRLEQRNIVVNDE